MLRNFAAALAAGVFTFSSIASAQKPVAPVAPPVHNHAEHGPRGGELLEVGNEEYHVELILDETKKQMVVYLLDSQVKTSVAIDAPHLVVNLKMAGKPVQIKLLPIPQETDKKGFSSRFGIKSPELVNAIHGGHADARLALKLGNKAYTVKIVHNHNHAGHTHSPATKK